MWGVLWCFRSFFHGQIVFQVWQIILFSSSFLLVVLETASIVHCSFTQNWQSDWVTWPFCMSTRWNFWHVYIWHLWIGPTIHFGNCKVLLKCTMTCMVTCQEGEKGGCSRKNLKIRGHKGSTPKIAIATLIMLWRQRFTYTLTCRFLSFDWDECAPAAPPYCTCILFSNVFVNIWQALHWCDL